MHVAGEVVCRVYALRRLSGKGIKMEEKKVWAKFKLKEILSNPAFLGRTVRLGDSIFEVKGIDKWLRIKEEKKNRMPFTAEFSFYEHVKRRTPPELRTAD
jgi:hypothetical protein